jgi:two-component system, NtrC family, response regulator HupR/HoxA
MATAGKKNTVLFVDDEIHILNAIRRATLGEHFDTMFALSGREALEVIAERTISVIVTDMKMPGMDGLTLLRAVRENSPKTIRMVLSGYTQLSQVLATVNQGDIFQFIPKPWQMEEELLSAVRQAIGYYNIDAERDVLRDKLVQKNEAYQRIFRELEQKFAHERKSVANMKRINHWTFSFLKKNLEMTNEYLEKNRDALKSYLNLIELLQLMYYDILPTITETNTAANLVATIITTCSDHIVINSPGRDDMKLVGSHSFVAMALKGLVSMLGADENAAVVCDMTVDAKEEEIFVTFSIATKRLNLSPLQHNCLKIGCALLSEIGKIYNLTVQPEVVNGEVVFVQTTWQPEPLERPACEIDQPCAEIM